MRYFEKAITAYYRNEVKSATNEVFNTITNHKLSSSDLSNLDACGVTLITKLLELDKSVVQINFYVIDHDVFSNANSSSMNVVAKEVADRFGVSSVYELRALMDAEAFFNIKTNYITCKVTVIENRDSYELYNSSADKLFSDILHELTHYFDKMSAVEYHTKNYVNALDNDLIGMPLTNEFNYLMYSIWSSTERNAFQTSNDIAWLQLKDKLYPTVNTLREMLNEDDDTVDLVFNALRSMFVNKTNKPCPKNDRLFIKWWCNKTISFFNEMDSKRLKDNYLAKSSDQQISKLSDDLFSALSAVLGKSTVKVTVPFNFYSTKRRTPHKEIIRLELIGFMGELDEAKILLQNSKIKFTIKDIPILSKVYTAITNRDIEFLKRLCVTLAGSIYRRSLNIL
mgnify:CR=1 FL=1